MTKEESVLYFITLINYLALTLKGMNVAIKESEISMAVLNGLPDRFDRLISAIDPLGNCDNALSFFFVKIRVLQEEQRINMRTKGSISKADTDSLVASWIPVANRRPKCGFFNKMEHTYYLSHKMCALIFPVNWTLRQNSRTSVSSHVSDAHDSGEF